MRVTTRARRCPSSSTRWPPSERARSSASWAIVPTACVSRVPSSFVQTASRRPPVRCATSTALSAGAAAVTSVSDASGKRQISRRGRTGSRRLPEGASPGSMVRGMVLRPAPEAPRPFAGEHRGQALTAVAREQLDVVLADARDPLEIAAGPRDRHPGHLAAERGAVARLARDAARRAPAGVPGVAKVDDRVRRALLELATRLGQLEADRLLPLRGRLQATRDTPAAHELPQPTLPTRPGEEGLSAFLRHPPHARGTDVRILAEAERLRGARLRPQEGCAERHVGREKVGALLVDQGNVHGGVAPAHLRREEADHFGRGVDAGVALRVALELEESLSREGRDLFPGEERVVSGGQTGSGAGRHA